MSKEKDKSCKSRRIANHECSTKVKNMYEKIEKYYKHKHAGYHRIDIKKSTKVIQIADATCSKCKHAKEKWK